MYEILALTPREDGTVDADLFVQQSEEIFLKDGPKAFILDSCHRFAP